MTEVAEVEAESGKKGGKKKLVLIAIPVLLLLIGAGLWFTGVIPGLLGHGAEKKEAKDEPAVPVFVDLPEIVANLDSNTRQPVFIKLTARLELAKQSDQAAVSAAMPRIQDLFQTYLRETRPEDLRGSGGTYRLREELIHRATLAASPARIINILFTQVLIQ